MTEHSPDSYLSRHKTELAIATMGSLAAALAAAGLYRKYHHDEPESPEYAGPDFQRQTAILIEPRLSDERRERINQLGALFVVQRHMTTATMLEMMQTSRHDNSKSLGYLRDYELVDKVQPRKKPVVIPGYFAVTPALDWAAQRPEEFTQLHYFVRQADVHTTGNDDEGIK